MRAARLLGAAILGLTVLGGLADAGTDSPSPPGPTPEPPVASLVLSIRVRALGFDPATIPESSNSLGLETVKAPTGAGVSRMPSATTEIARGVYLTVMPACLPGVDDVGFPSAVRRRPPFLRGQ